MRLKIATLGIPLGLTAIVVFFPRFTAQQLEAHRKQELLRQAEATVALACPVGDERDALLSRRFKVHNTWLPVCRELPPEAGKVIIERESRADYGHCREQLKEQSRAGCFLNEPLAFLADDQPRTVARMERADAMGQQIVWVTPQPLAWGDHLIDEHRRYLVFFIFGAMLCSLLAVAGQHARGIYVSQRRIQPGADAVPGWAEFWLRFFLHPYAQSYPVDLQDDYELWLKTVGREEATVMCWLHVRRALPALMLMHVQGWFPVLGRFVR